MRSITRGHRSIAVAIALGALSSVAHAGAAAQHPTPQPIVVTVDDGFHWGDAGIGAAAGVGAALIVAGGLVLTRGDRAAVHNPNHTEAKR